MSTFVTNNNTRRTKRARVNNVRAQNGEGVVASALGNSFQGNSELKSRGRNNSLVTTQIGSHNSKGIVIVGGAALTDYNQPSNPDGLDIPLSRRGEDAETLANPPFPITYTGPGYLAFQNEVALPFIKGNVNVRGDLTVDGYLHSATPAALGLAPFIPVITDALGNELDVAVADSVYKSHTTIDYFEALITWTGSTLLGVGSALRITGLPLSTYSVASQLNAQGLGGITTSTVGGQFRLQIVNGADYMLLQEVDQLAGTVPTAVTDANLLAGAGSLQVSGWLRKL